MLLTRARAILARLLSAAVLPPVAALLGLLLLGAWPEGVFTTTRAWLFDAYQRLSPPTRSAPGTLIVAIDGRSIREIGQWPWPRDVLARLVDAASPARVVGIDLLLSETDRLSPENWARGRLDMPHAAVSALSSLPSTDGLLAQSIARTPVVIAVAGAGCDPTGEDVPLAVAPVVEAGGDPRGALPRYACAHRPVPALAAAARGLGVVSAPTDQDGFIRRLPAMVAVGTSLMPGFSIEVLRVALGGGPIEVRGEEGGVAELRVAGRPLRVDHEGQAWPRFAPTSPADMVAAVDLLRGTVDPGRLAGRVVLIGATAPGLGDIVSSPLHRALPGVAFHAALVDSALAGDLLGRPRWTIGLELLLTAVAGVLAIALLGRVSFWSYAVALVGTSVAIVAGSWLLFRGPGLLLDATMPIAALTLAALVTLAARTHDEVRARRRHQAELAQALVRAEAADRAKTEFLANVSHELRTPLSAIIGFSEVMANQMMGALPPTYAGYAQDINRSGRHLLAIIEDLLTLSVLDLGGARAADDRVDVAAALAECERMASVHARGRSVDLVCEVEPGLPDMRADIRMLRQMVVNLLSNAIKYSRQGGTVRLHAGLRDRWLCISVQDAGPGIAPADIPHVMQRFGRLQSASLAQEPGIGIGLPLTKSMVELHGGRLELRSEIGIGTQALLWLPPARLENGGH